MVELLPYIQTYNIDNITSHSTYKRSLKIPKGVIRSRKSKKQKEKGHKDKQRSTKHYTEN